MLKRGKETGLVRRRYPGWRDLVVLGPFQVFYGAVWTVRDMAEDAYHIAIF